MSETFCPIPWNFLAVRNNGDLRVCCQANVSASRGLLRDSHGQILNARSANLTASRNTELVKAMRLRMLNGEWSENCGRCKSEEENGLSSRRKYEIEAWKMGPSDVAAHTAADGSIDTEKLPLRYFDIRFGNKCNLACRMCGPNDSDSWYGDHVELTGQTWFADTHGKVSIEKNTNGQYKDKANSYNWYELDHFWQEILKHASTVAQIYFAGGEPLLIEQHYLFLEKCIDLGVSQNIIIEYNTNATILPQRVLDLWANFRRVRLGLSVDGIGTNLEYQRHPAKWIAVEKNLRKINSIENSNIDAWLACTVTAYNAFHLPEFIEWKLTANLANINRHNRKPIITHHMAHKPEHLNVRIFSNKMKSGLQELYATSLKKIATQHGPLMEVAAQRIYDGILKYANSDSYHLKHWHDFVRFTKKMDQIRNQDHNSVLPPQLSQEINFFRI